MTSEQAVARLIELLEHQAVAYMLVGAFSSNLYGVPRATCSTGRTSVVGPIPTGPATSSTNSAARPACEE
jgi:hypothetical protein